MANSQVMVFDATIKNGASLQAEATQCWDNAICGLVCPAGVSGTVVTFQVSYDSGTTWVNAYDANGNEIQVTIAASRYVSINPVWFACARQVKLRTGTASTPTAQSADKTFQIVTRRA